MRRYHIQGDVRTEMAGRTEEIRLARRAGKHVNVGQKSFASNTEERWP